MHATQVNVGLAEIQVIKGEGVFNCIGLGSCVSVAVMDQVANVSGVAFIMLPESNPTSSGDRPGKFADQGVPQLVEMMERLGADRNRMQAVIVGGAQVFRAAKQNKSPLHFGDRNTVAVIDQLKRMGIKCVAQDVGGFLGRSMNLETGTGKVVVRTPVAGERTICELKG